MSSCVQEMCSREVTEEDMLHKLFVREELGHEDGVEGVVVRRKGNRTLPWSDGDEWKFGKF